VIKILQFSILLGAKQSADKPDQEPARENH
jgi:hypothetical protein